MADASRAVASLLKQAGREIESEVTGSSMVPALAPGVRIRIHCGARPAAGDIAAYVGDPRLIAHRVIARVSRLGQPYLMMRGDANPFCDSPVAESRVLGVVTAFRDGPTWRPVPAAALPSLGTRLSLSLSYALIRAGLVLGERQAFSVSLAVSRLVRRLQQGTVPADASV